MFSDLPQTALALIEGLGLALSPCILPILPFILAASANKGRLRPFLIIAGFIISFTAFSLISRQILSLLDVPQDNVQTAAYIILLILGIIMMVPYLEARFASSSGGLAGWAQKKTTGAFADSVPGGLMVGALIGLVWTPCAGPILATALLQVIQAQTSFAAFMTIAAFSVGAGIPMLIIALFGQYLTNHLRVLSRHATLLRRIMGGLIVSFALLALGGFNIGEWAATRGITVGPAPQGEVLALRHGLDAPYVAPPLAGITQWMNTDPIDLGAMKGKVVLIDFWTYSCINCIRTLPYLKAWYERYKDQGFVVIGVHAPEFAFEAKPDNVAQALDKFGISYPVALDNDFATWRNYKNRYWPAHYLIDRDGKVVYTHFGEGAYDVTEDNIRYLLGLGRADHTQKINDVTAVGQTPETYLGMARVARESLRSDNLDIHEWNLSGAWKRTTEYIESTQAGDQLTLRYNARKVFLVMESADGTALEAFIANDGAPSITPDDANIQGALAVQSSRLYEIIHNKDMKPGTVTIKAGRAGLRLYAFTFEG